MGIQSSQFYGFDHNKMKIYKDNALTDELGYPESERSMHWPAVNAGMSKIAAFHRAFWVKKHGVRFE